MGQHRTALADKCMTASETENPVWVCLDDNGIRRDAQCSGLHCPSSQWVTGLALQQSSLLCNHAATALLPAADTRLVSAWTVRTWG